MIRVYWLDCSALMDETVLENALPYLGAERREKTLRLQTAERRAQSAAAGLLLRHLFGDTEYTYGINTEKGDVFVNYDISTVECGELMSKGGALFTGYNELTGEEESIICYYTKRQ